MKNDVLYYSVGPLLYCPANQQNIAQYVIEQKLGSHFSLALCLEDTIPDGCVAKAEQSLVQSIGEIYTNCQTRSFYLPKIFIRVRDAAQISRLMHALGDSIAVLAGFILPKFSPANAERYIEAAIYANEASAKPLYVMPIYESAAIVDLRKRIDTLYALKDSLSRIENLVLNIRVGGNDLCHLFGFRRRANQSIHHIRPIADIFSDIITVYGADYVISGPVWEYYRGENWEKGFEHEIEEDKLCGFIGKTVIHPNQIPVLNRAYQVNRTDYHDAQSILHWNQSTEVYVSGNCEHHRMNEYKTHSTWAKQTLWLAQVFGIKEG